MQSIDAKIESLALRAGNLRASRQVRARCRLRTTSYRLSSSVLRTEAVRTVRWCLSSRVACTLINKIMQRQKSFFCTCRTNLILLRISLLFKLTCGLVEVTLEVDRSITDPPGEVGGPPGFCICCTCATVTHFTTTFMR